jgi:hypothetical protein
MKRGFVLRRNAEKEFNDSIAWYKNEREGFRLEAISFELCNGSCDGRTVGMI